MARYRQKTIEVEAVRFNGRNAAEVEAFSGWCHYDPMSPKDLFSISANDFIDEGDYIVKCDGAVEIIPEGDFHARYEPV